MLWMNLAASSWKDESCVFNRDTTPKEKSEFSTALHSERRYGAANTIVRKLKGGHRSHLTQRSVDLPLPVVRGSAHFLWVTYDPTFVSC